MMLCVLTNIHVADGLRGNTATAPKLYGKGNTLTEVIFLCSRNCHQHRLCLQCADRCHGCAVCDNGEHGCGSPRRTQVRVEGKGESGKGVGPSGISAIPVSVGESFTVIRKARIRFLLATKHCLRASNIHQVFSGKNFKSYTLFFKTFHG